MPATILAIDTATEICSVALAIDGQLLESSERVDQRHSERVLPMIEALLGQRNLRLADCDAIAFGAGPGAFTGLRIACGIAQGLACGAAKPVVAVSNLAALARAAAGERGAACVLTAIDARMQEMYWAVYAVDEGAVAERAAPSLAKPEALADLCRQHRPDLIAGNALRAFPSTAAALGAFAVAPDARAGAAHIALLAAAEFAAGRAVAAAEAAPIYVRDRVALTITERQSRAAQ